MGQTTQAELEKTSRLNIYLPTAYTFIICSDYLAISVLFHLFSEFFTDDTLTSRGILYNILFDIKSKSLFVVKHSMNPVFIHIIKIYMYHGVWVQNEVNTAT